MFCATCGRKIVGGSVQVDKLVYHSGDKCLPEPLQARKPAFNPNFLVTAPVNRESFNTLSLEATISLINNPPLYLVKGGKD